MVAIFILNMGIGEGIRTVTRVKRSNSQWPKYLGPLRPTKRLEFAETEGRPVGKVMFQLEREGEDEVFGLRFEANPWVTVDPDGAVRVKKEWDHEALRRHAIRLSFLDDIWVEEGTITFFVMAVNGSESQKETQKVVITVAEVKEDPYFLNQPQPMQTVVPLDAPAGTLVYTLQAVDPLTANTSSTLIYCAVRDQTGGRFRVDELSGEVRTLGSEPFLPGLEYPLHVRASTQTGDCSGYKGRTSDTHRLSIVGGARWPQFYSAEYEAKIPENQTLDTAILSVKAKSFADSQITYTMEIQGQGEGTFHMNATTGTVSLAKPLDQ